MEFSRNIKSLIFAVFAEFQVPTKSSNVQIKNLYVAFASSTPPIGAKPATLFGASEFPEKDQTTLDRPQSCEFDP